MQKETIDSLFNHIDKEKSGSIEYTELSKALRSVRIPTRARVVHRAASTQTDVLGDDMASVSSAGERQATASALAEAASALEQMQEEAAEWRAQAELRARELESARAEARTEARAAQTSAAATGRPLGNAPLGLKCSK